MVIPVNILKKNYFRTLIEKSGYLKKITKSQTPIYNRECMVDGTRVSYNYACMCVMLHLY